MEQEFNGYLKDTIESAGAEPAASGVPAGYESRVREAMTKVKVRAYEISATELRKKAPRPGYLGVQDRSDLKYFGATLLVFVMVFTLISIPVVAPRFPYELTLEVGTLSDYGITVPSPTAVFLPDVYAMEGSGKTYQAQVRVGTLPVEVKVRTLDLSTSVDSQVLTVAMRGCGCGPYMM